jgi:tetratricopeptide (TPR) repeat protein
MSSSRRIAIGVTVAVCSIVLFGCGGAQSRLASHMERGQQYFSQGDFTKASIEFRNAMQIAPKDPAALVMAGRTAERLGRLRDAVSLFQTVVDSNPDNVEARQYLGRLLALHGQPDRALTVVEPALAKHPDEPALLTIRAAARLESKNPAGALADIERALQLAPENEEAILFRAGLYRKAGDLESATALVTGGLAKSPASTDLKEALVSLYEAAHQPGKAEEQLHALVAQKPQDPQFRYQLATFYAEENKLDDAERVFREAVKVFHTDDARVRLVGFLSAHRDSVAAEKALREFVAASPADYDLRLALGSLLQGSGKSDDAKRTYGEVIHDDGTGPAGLIARDRIAALQSAQGQYDDARKLVDEVLQKSPRDSMALAIRGEIELARHEAPAAIADLRGSLRDQPQSVAIHQLLAKAYMANGEPALAEESLRAAMDQIPGNMQLRLDLAAVLTQRHDLDRALELLEQSARAAPEDPYVRQALARVYLAKRDFTSARATAETLKTLRPDSPAGFYLAGLAEQGRNQLDDAHKEFTRALAIQPQSSDALAALAQLELTRGHGDQAIALLQDAAEHPHPNAFAYNLLGEIYLSQRKADPARAPISRAMQLAPKWWMPYRNLAIAKYGSGDTAGAIDSYVAGIKAAPTEPTLVVELAQLYQKQGRIDDAVASYEAWVRQNPRVPVVANNLAMLLVTYKQDRASLDLARDLTNTFESSTDSSLLDTNGWVHFKRSEYSAALSVLERAVALAPDSKEIHYHLAMAELRMGQTDRARTDLETAVSGSAKFSGADDARTLLASLKGRSS